MHIPGHFEQKDKEAITDFIHKNSFGILISQVAKKPWATHIPLVLAQDNQGKAVLQGHISKGNKQWKDFTANEEVLCIFNGPHAYISSSWYDHENVPTWNYIAIHVYGRIRLVDGEALLSMLKTLVNKYEAASIHPVSVETMTPGFLKNELRGIIGFEIAITSIEAAYKLSQNRDDKNKEMIQQELLKRGDEQSKQISEWMKSYKR